MNLFLSYARQDEEMGCEIAASLGQRGFDVYHWRDPRQRGGRFLERIEQEIGRADAFLALVSPHFLASGWCRLESDLAMYRENSSTGPETPRARLSTSCR